MAKPRRMPMDGERIREAMGGPARVRPGVPMTHTMASEARGSGTAVAASTRVNGTSLCDGELCE